MQCNHFTTKYSNLYFTIKYCISRSISAKIKIMSAHMGRYTTCNKVCDGEKSTFNNYNCHFIIIYTVASSISAFNHHFIIKCSTTSNISAEMKMRVLKVLI